MSGVVYVSASGGGEVSYFEETLSVRKTHKVASVIASDIVNEILENALDIAMQSNDTGIPWKEIKDSRSNSKASLNSTVTNETCSKHGEHTTDADGLQIRHVCTNIVGDIVEHMGLSSPANISQVIDGLNSINASQNKEDIEPLDVGMTKLLTEMLSPPYEITNYDSASLKGGVGDHPNDEKLINITDEPAEEQEIPKAVEKKSRVTDLVKNSPQIISEYLMMDEHAKQTQDEWEESEEQLIHVIELDYVKPGEELFRGQRTIFPEKIALPKEDDEDDLVGMPSDDIMDIIDLSTAAFKEEERHLSSVTLTYSGAKGDDRNSDNIEIVTPYETGSSGGEIIENFPVPTQKQACVIRKDINTKEQKVKKKKWNFGTRFWGLFKKEHKPQEQGSSTST